MVGGRLKRAGIHIYLQLIRAVVQQKPTQHCKAIFLQLKNKLKKEEEEAGPVGGGGDSGGLGLNYGYVAKVLLLLLLLSRFSRV